MTVDELIQNGAEIVGGTIIFRRQDIGRLTVDGPLLTPDGEEAMAAAALGASPLSAPAPRARARRTARNSEVLES